MGPDSQRPPLPAPTDPSTLDSADESNLRDDVDTNVSARTDKSSYSVPEDGTPITINTSKAQGGTIKKFPSQTSLLIEYFEAGPTEGLVHSRPRVRVRVTPSSRRTANKVGNDQVHIAQTTHHARKPAYIRRISLGSKPRDEVIDTRTTDYSDISNFSLLPPVEIEVLQNHSDISSDGDRFHLMPSDVSSMPPDSLLGEKEEILPPGRRRSRSLERETVTESVSVLSDAPDTLKAPKHQRSRSLSKDRITQRVMEKLAAQQAAAEVGIARAKESRSRTKTTTKHSKEELASSRKSHRRSKDVEEGSALSGTDSSLLSSNADRRSGLGHSARSVVSGTSSVVNPKLVATVEDAIKRLILPELNALKEENRSSRNRDKFDDIRKASATYETLDSTSSRDPSRRRVSKSSSAPKLSHGAKPKVVLNRSADDPGTVLSGGGHSSRKGERRSSRGSTSDRSYAESTTREEKSSGHRRKSSKDKDGTSSRDKALAGLAGAGLTAAALKHHTSHEEKREERRHSKHRSSRVSGSRSASVTESEDVAFLKAGVPPLPFGASELQSELTRESILSADTETKERPESRDSRSSRSSTFIETPLLEVSRGYVSPGPRTPSRTPNALQQTLKTAHSNRSTGEVRLPMTPKSDRSYTSRTRETTQASLEATAAAKVRAIERSEPHASEYEIESESPNRGVSPIQSEASYREEDVANGSPRRRRSFQSRVSVSSLGEHFEGRQSKLSIASMESTASTKAARTRKRPQGVTLESKRSILGDSGSPGAAEDFFEKNHEQNEMYRRQLEDRSELSPVNYNRMTQYTDDSVGVEYLDQDNKVIAPDEQNLQKVGSNPEYVHTPLAVESAVASLHDPSTMSVRSSNMSSPIKKSRLSQVSPSPLGEYVQTHEVPQSQQWGTIRDRAEALMKQGSANNSPRQSIAQSIDEQPQMHHSAFPAGKDEAMPEIGYGISDNESEVDTNPSIIQGPIGGVDGYHNDQKKEFLRHQDDRDRTPTSFNKGAAVGTGTGAAAIAAAAAYHLRDQSPGSFDDDDNRRRHQATVQDDYDESALGEQQYDQSGYAQSNRTPLSGPTGWKDEGYQSANQREVYTPQNRPHSKSFDDDGYGDEYDGGDLGGPDLFSNSKHQRQASGNSHGLQSPLYDAATGKGMDRIQSKDIVALMDHLTVRDAQRNARDTEILVTLVRSAAEMRNQLDEMKQFIKVQDNMIMGTTDKRIGLAEQRILGGPRPQPMASSRVNKSSSDAADAGEKKKSVFKRALKGLSMKGDSDMKNIESMLMQLLDEMEGLKQSHQLALDQQARSNSLTSYENLRASGASADPGYEPEGRANTASSPNQSGFLSNPSTSRRIQDLHSGYDVLPTNRISTVHEEDDEEYEERDAQYENTERMTTPTQEAFHQKNGLQQTPPQASRGIREPSSQDDTPKRKHKSNSSSIFGMPKISRWSKTTSSTNNESLPRNSGSGDKRPYSAHSRSSSQNSEDYDDYDDYELRADDRLRSNSSLAKDEGGSMQSVRSPSPLIPEEHLQYEMEDPKYQAHRNSLNLQHPQPRAGPTGRHQSHLETQAQIYEPITSPDYDSWGSMPALARNRLSGGGAHQYGGNLSPISSDGGYSQHSASEQQQQQQQQAPPRPPKIVDDGPLIPPQQTLAGYGQTRQMYSSPNEFGSQGVLTPLAPIAEVRYSLETDRGHRMSPAPSPRPSTGNLRNGAMDSPQRKITGPRPMGNSRSPAPQQQQQQSPLQHSDTVIRRKPIHDDEESLLSYVSSNESETF